MALWSVCLFAEGGKQQGKNGENGAYSLLSGICTTGTGPYTFGTYLWAKFDNLTAWEKKLVEGPYIHHMAEIEGDYTAELEEFCKYIPALAADKVK